jgi:hypothetical protein
VKLLTRYTGKHRKSETAELMLTPLCPWCGGFVTFRLACETFEENGKWWVHKDCDRAVMYRCRSYEGTEPECTWMYIHGLNQRNPSWDHNEDRRPTWLVEGQQPYDEEGYLWTAPGVER